MNIIKKYLSSKTYYVTILVSIITLFSTDIQRAATENSSLPEKGKWNFIVYIAGNNNLHKFTLRTIKQMLHVGSNENINLLVQLDQWGHRKITRYHIEKDHAQVVSSFEATSQLSSGTPNCLYDCVKWAVTNYKAEKTALILWNHGSGILDPHIWGRLLSLDRDELFVFNPETCMLELDRDVLLGRIFHLKGIAFNDTFEAYISNQELKETLDKISTELLGGKKIDLLGMDACHMAMLEIASQVKSAVRYLVASQEIEPGPGWNYVPFLETFKHKKVNEVELADSIVNAYKEEYVHITPDYTQSAFDLSVIDEVEKNVSAVATLLINLMKMQGGESVINLIKRIRTNGQYTTAFYNYNYIDLHHFYTSVQSLLTQQPFSNELASKFVPLQKKLTEGIALLEKFVIANAAGPSLKNAFGVSIYFPPRTIHNSYLRTIFGQTNSWIDFIATYLKRVGRPDMQGEEPELIISPEGSRNKINIRGNHYEKACKAPYRSNDRIIKKDKLTHTQ